MFSVMSIHHSVHGGPHVTIHMMHYTSLYPLPQAARPSPNGYHLCIRHGTLSPPLVTSGGDHWRPFQTF